MNGTTSQARIFAELYAKDAASKMLGVIDAIATRAKKITAIALGVSMPHQIGYLLSLAIPHMRFNDPSGWLEAITMVLLTLGVPIATDLLILSCIETIGAAAASAKSKWHAFWLMIAPVTASASVNFLAPAPMLLKVLAAFIVAMVPMAVSLRFTSPDFAKIEAIENEVAASVGRSARSMTEQEKASRNITREWNRYHKMTPAARRRYRDEHGGPPPAPQRVTRAVIPTSPAMPAVDALSAQDVKQLVG